MKPRAEEEGSGSDSDPGVLANSSGAFTAQETEHALAVLEKDPSKYLSGNGFKGKATTDIAASLKKKFPGRPIRKADTVGNRLRYVIIRVRFLANGTDIASDQEDI